MDASRVGRQHDHQVRWQRVLGQLNHVHQRRLAIPHPLRGGPAGRPADRQGRAHSTRRRWAGPSSDKLWFFGAGRFQKNDSATTFHTNIAYPNTVDDKRYEEADLRPQPAAQPEGRLHLPHAPGDQQCVRGRDGPRQLLRQRGAHLAAVGHPVTGHPLLELLPGGPVPAADALVHRLGLALHGHRAAP